MKHKKVKKNRTSQKLISLILLFSVVVLISLKMYQSFLVDLQMQELRKLDLEKKSLINQHEQILADVENMRNIDCITDRASKELGLVINTDEIQVIRLQSESTFEEIQKRFAERNKKSERYNLAGVN